MSTANHDFFTLRIWQKKWKYSSFFLKKERKKEKTADCIYMNCWLNKVVYTYSVAVKCLQTSRKLSRCLACRFVPDDHNCCGNSQSVHLPRNALGYAIVHSTAVVHRIKHCQSGGEKLTSLVCRVWFNGIQRSCTRIGVVQYINNNNTRKKERCQWAAFPSLFDANTHKIPSRVFTHG